MSIMHIKAWLIADNHLYRFGDIDFDEPESVVRKMALPKIRGGIGPIKKKKETAFEV